MTITTYVDDITVEEFTGVVAAFTYEGSVNLPITHYFTDVTICIGCTADSWHWDFGIEGASSDLQNPSYAFPSAGTYNVTLTVTAGEYSDSYTQPITLYEPSQTQGTTSGNWFRTPEIYPDNIIVDFYVTFTVSGGNLYIGIGDMAFMPNSSANAIYMRWNYTYDKITLITKNAATGSHSIEITSPKLTRGVEHHIQFVIYPRSSGCIDYYLDGQFLARESNTTYIPYDTLLGLDVYGQLLSSLSSSGTIVGGAHVEGTPTYSMVYCIAHEIELHDATYDTTIEYIHGDHIDHQVSLELHPNDNAYSIYAPSEATIEYSDGYVLYGGVYQNITPTPTVVQFIRTDAPLGNTPLTFTVYLTNSIGTITYESPIPISIDALIPISDVMVSQAQTVSSANDMVRKIINIIDTLYIKIRRDV